ncbi:30S ribosomal protein S9, partial [Nocardia sp. NPDC060220]|uniref:30S ribosomal protein S9 n=1 Tax=Nocardia sp. NPDC060220 TaxID=3347076 RepID=UPI00364DD758
MTAPEEFAAEEFDATDEVVVEIVEDGEGYAEGEYVEEELAFEPLGLDRPVQTVGRRKEAVVRVRMVPGSGNFELNGRTLEDYFPNKVHQQ